jgi:hypothetical protein
VVAVCVALEVCDIEDVTLGVYVIEDVAVAVGVPVNETVDVTVGL